MPRRIYSLNITCDQSFVAEYCDFLKSFRPGFRASWPALMHFALGRWYRFPRAQSYEEDMSGYREDRAVQDCVFLVIPWLQTSMAPNGLWPLCILDCVACMYPAACRAERCFVGFLLLSETPWYHATRYFQKYQWAFQDASHSVGTFPLPFHWLGYSEMFNVVAFEGFCSFVEHWICLNTDTMHQHIKIVDQSWHRE